ncbi:MAG: histidine kinase [Gemmatimonadaceae bacterium]
MRSATIAVHPPRSARRVIPRVMRHVMGRAMRPRLWVAGVLAWLAVVALFTMQERYASRWGGATHGWHPLLLRHAIGWAIWAPLAPVVAWLVRRFPLRGPSAARHLVLHVPLGGAVAALHTLLLAAVYPLFYYAPSLAALRDVFRDRLYSAFGVDLLVYAALAAGAAAVAGARDAQRQELARTRLEARAARAELALLHGQLQPHFLFNALNSLVELVDADPPRATRMIRSLSDLLRRSLASVGSPRSTLRAELAFVERYVEIQQIRFPRLRVDVATDPDILDVAVPSLVLQPLVENAIRYTVGARGAGRVLVRGRRDGESLRLTVEDDGVGAAPGTAHGGPGTGLANIRARLEHLYGEGYTLRLETPAGGGALVTLVLPLAMPPEMAHAPGEAPGDA